MADLPPFEGSEAAEQKAIGKAGYLQQRKRRQPDFVLGILGCMAQNRGAKVASMDIGVMRVFFQTAPMVYANIARLAAENWTAPHMQPAL